MLKEIARQYTGKLETYHPFATVDDRAAWEGLDDLWKQVALLKGEARLGFSWPYLSMTEYLDFSRTGNRRRFEAVYFSKRKALGDLVLAECVENRGRFMDDIVNGIFSICDETTWCLPAHNYTDKGRFLIPDKMEPIVDLFAAETGAVVATALYLLESVLNRMDPAIARRMRCELEQRIMTPCLERRFNWMGGKGKTNNWTVWCAQNVLITATLGGTQKERLRKVFDGVCESADYFLADYEEDGCCDEGASYYRQSALCLSQIMEICSALTKGAFDGLYQEAKIRNMVMYLYHMHVDGKYYINFSDCSAMPGVCGVREYLTAGKVGSESLRNLAAQDIQEGGLAVRGLTAGENNLFVRLQHAFTVREMMQYPVKADIPGEDIFYPSTGIMVVRDGSLTLAARGGDNGDSHNHNDVGSFTVYKNGRPLLIDVGVETYSRKTFSPQRYEIWTMQSAYHNLPTIDGFMQRDGERYGASDTVCDLKNCTLDTDIRGAYPAETGLAFYHRRSQLIKGEEILIKDSFSFSGKGSHQVILSLMVSEEPVVEENCIRVGDGTGTILLEQGCVQTVETIPVEDMKLKAVWGERIYRVLAAAERGGFIIHVK